LWQRKLECQDQEEVKVNIKTEKGCKTERWFREQLEKQLTVSTLQLTASYPSLKKHKSNINIMFFTFPRTPKEGNFQGINMTNDLSKAIRSLEGSNTKP
jgi:hypothetical protein